MKAEGPYFSKKKAPFVHKIDARALFEKKRRHYFLQNVIFFNRKSALWMSGIEKAPFFDLGLRGF